MTTRTERKKGAPESMRWLDYTVWTAALWASFLNLLNFNQYPLFRPEVGLTLLGLALAGSVMGVVQQVARPALAFLIASLFAAVAVDLNASISANWFLVAWIALAVVAYFALNTFLKLVLAAATGVLVFQLAALTTGIGQPDRSGNDAQNLQAAGSPASDRPAIVHLVLDSYLGLDGMALGPEVYRDLRADQAAFFTGRGFQIYPRAYSRHTKTLNALPYLFSYGGDMPAIDHVNDQYAIPEQLPYFADLDRRGYRISATLPAYFDLCVKQKLTHCRLFESSALTSMLGSEAGTLDRARIFAFNMIQTAHLPARLAVPIQLGINSFSGKEGRFSYNRGKLFPLASLKELDRFADELADIENGEVRLAHLLLPHDPYMLDPDCSLRPEDTWFDEHGPGEAAARETAYAAQVRCLQAHLGRMLDVLQQSPAGREAIVLIHGDHGSRIAPYQPRLGAPELTDREMLMSHATMFAIRVPGEAAGEVPGAYALDELMADFRARDFAAAPHPEPAPARVLMMDHDWVPSEWRPLPSFDARIK